MKLRNKFILLTILNLICITSPVFAADYINAEISSPAEVKNTIQIQFDGNLNPDTVTAENFSIENGPAVLDASADGSLCTLTLSEKLYSGGEYNVSVSNVSGENGEEIGNESRYLYFNTFSSEGEDALYSENNENLDGIWKKSDGVSVCTLNGNKYFAPGFDEEGYVIYHTGEIITGFSFYTCIHGSRDTSTFFEIYISEDGEQYTKLTEDKDYSSVSTTEYIYPDWTWSTCRYKTAEKGTLPPCTRYLKIVFPRIYSEENHSKSAAILGKGTVNYIKRANAFIPESGSVKAENTLKVMFSKAVSDIRSEYFALDGANVVSAEGSSDSESAVLTLDRPLKNDSEYILTLSEGLKFADGTDIGDEYKSLKFKTKPDTNPVSYGMRTVKIGDGGMNVGFAMHPQNNKILYARTDVGGLYRRDFENNKWIPLNDSLGSDERNLYSVAGVGLDPNNENVVYIACGSSWKYKGALLKSTDKGNTWVKTGLDVTFNTGGSFPRFAGECIAVDPTDSNIVYCGTQYDGLWKSTDAGMNWTQVSEIPVGYTPDYSNISTANRDSGIRSILFGEDNKLYVGVNPGPDTDGGVYVYDGSTWTLTADSPKNVMMLRSAGSVIYASDVPSGTSDSPADLYKYENGIWTEISAPEDSISYVIDAMEDSSSNRYLFSAGKNDNRLYYKKNDGAWKAVLEADGSSRIAASPYWCSIIKYDITSLHVYEEDGAVKAWAGNGAAVFSTDNVLSLLSPYRCEVENYEELCVYTLASPAWGDVKLYAGNMDYSGFRITDTNDYSAVSIISNMKKDVNSGEFVHSNAIASFDVCACNPDFAACSFIATGGEYTGVATSSDGGKEFVQFENNIKEAYGYMPGNVAVGAEVLETGYPALVTAGVVTDGSDSSGVLYSEDFGRTWQKSEGIPSAIITTDRQYQRKILCADAVNGEVFYINDVATGTLYVSTDRGKTFTAYNENPEVQVYSEYLRSSIEANPVKSGEMCFSTYESGLFITEDYGRTVKRMPYISDVEGFSYGAPDYHTNYAGMFFLGKLHGIRGLYFSADGGASWRRINDDRFSLGKESMICGDKSTFGTVYIATAGRGVFVAEMTADFYEDFSSQDYEESGYMEVSGSISYSDSFGGSLALSGSGEIILKTPSDGCLNRVEFTLHGTEGITVMTSFNGEDWTACGGEYNYSCSDGSYTFSSGYLSDVRYVKLMPKSGEYISGIHIYYIPEEAELSVESYTESSITLKFSEAVQAVSTDNFTLYCGDDEIPLTNAALSDDSTKCVLSLGGTLQEYNEYRLRTSEAVRAKSGAGIKSRCRVTDFTAYELYPGDKIFTDEMKDLSKTYSYFNSLREFKQYDPDSSALAASSRYAEVTYRVNGEINSFDVDTVYHGISGHDGTWRFFASSDGNSWTRLIQSDDYTTRYIQPDSDWKYSYARFDSHTGNLEGTDYRYLKIVYPIRKDEAYAEDSSRGVLNVSIGYEARTFCKIKDGVKSGDSSFTVVFERPVETVDEYGLILRDSGGNTISVSSGDIQQDGYEYIIYTESPLAEGEYTLEMPAGTASISGIELSSVCRELNFRAE